MYRLVLELGPVQGERHWVRIGLQIGFFLTLPNSRCKIACEKAVACDCSFAVKMINGRNVNLVQGLFCLKFTSFPGACTCSVQALLPICMYVSCLWVWVQETHKHWQFVCVKNWVLSNIYSAFHAVSVDRPQQRLSEMSGQQLLILPLLMKWAWCYHFLLCVKCLRHGKWAWKWGGSLFLSIFASTANSNVTLLPCQIYPWASPTQPQHLRLRTLWDFHKEQRKKKILRYIERHKQKCLSQL